MEADKKEQAVETDLESNETDGAKEDHKAEDLSESKGKDETK